MIVFKFIKTVDGKNCSAATWRYSKMIVEYGRFKLSRGRGRTPVFAFNNVENALSWGLIINDHNLWVCIAKKSRIHLDEIAAVGSVSPVKFWSGDSEAQTVKAPKGTLLCDFVIPLFKIFPKRRIFDGSIAFFPENG